MRIAMKTSGQRHPTLLVCAAATALAAVYFEIMVRAAGASHIVPIVLALISGASVIGYLLLSESKTVLTIDDAGIYDKRIGVGPIPWRDVEDVTFELGYGSRYLCLRTRNPRPYLARVRGKKKEKLLFHQSLGFQRFNVDISQLEVNVLDLKKAVESRIAEQRTQASP